MASPLEDFIMAALRTQFGGRHRLHARLYLTIDIQSFVMAVAQQLPVSRFEALMAAFIDQQFLPAFDAARPTNLDDYTLQYLPRADGRLPSGFDTTASMRGLEQYIADARTTRTMTNGTSVVGSVGDLSAMQSLRLHDYSPDPADGDRSLDSLMQAIERGTGTRANPIQSDGPGRPVRAPLWPGKRSIAPAGYWAFGGPGDVHLAYRGQKPLPWLFDQTSSGSYQVKRTYAQFWTANFNAFAASTFGTGW